MTSERKRKVDKQRAAGGKTFVDVLRDLIRRPMTGLKVIVVLAACAVASQAVVPQPYTFGVLFAVGVPLAVWIIRRDQQKQEASTKHRTPRGSGSDVTEARDSGD